MAKSINRAQEIINNWKGEDYAHGVDVLDKTGAFAEQFGGRALLVVSGLVSGWIMSYYKTIKTSLDRHGVRYTTIMGSAPNSPREDVYRIANETAKTRPDVIVAVGGGSTIDAVKAASVLATYSTDQVMEHLGVTEAPASTIEPYFGVGNITRIKEATDISPIPVVAVETVASSAAHLTKYANVTDPVTGQKKLIVDDVVVPPKAVFDYHITVSTPKELALDGGLDGISHLWEVFMGATGHDYYNRVKEIAVEGISLIIENLPVAVRELENINARVALGYGTDLGGYAIMIGGTNGGHLGSFSLVDVLSHGRACAVLNPYYTVLFAPVIQDQLRVVGEIFINAGFIGDNLNSLEGKALGEAVAQGMTAFLRSIEFPTTLREAGATKAHIDRMIAAAKNPQLDSKLKNMPAPMNPAKGDVDTYMRPVLEAAFTGDFSLIKDMPL